MMSETACNSKPVAAVSDRSPFDGSADSAVGDRRYRLGNIGVTVLRFVLAAVFMVAGGLKIADPIGFARNIVDYDLVPELFAPMIAVVLPWWEVGAAALAVAGRWKIGALTMLAGMSAAFLVMGVITLARGLSVECGCFGFLSERVGPVSVSVEAALAVVSGWLLRSEARNQKTASTRQ